MQSETSLYEASVRVVKRRVKLASNKRKKSHPPPLPLRWQAPGDAYSQAFEEL